MSISNKVIDKTLFTIFMLAAKNFFTYKISYVVSVRHRHSLLRMVVPMRTTNKIFFQTLFDAVVCFYLICSHKNFSILARCVSECVEAGNVLLGCRVKKEALGL